MASRSAQADKIADEMGPFGAMAAAASTVFDGRLKTLSAKPDFACARLAKP